MKIATQNYGLLVAVMAFAALSVPARVGGEEVLKLRPSPRLWVSPDTALHLKDKLHTPYLRNEARRVIEDADWLVDAPPIAEGESSTYQQGTRAIASHLQCLTAAWVLTHDPKYRKAAIRHLGNLLTWNQVSCEARPGMSHETPMFFCLSYGEHAADIGLMYDLFRPDMTAQEQAVFFAVLDRFYLKEALRCVERPPWWAFKSWSNWNGVCAGGMGIMALAFYDDRPECRRLIPFVEKSLAEYFKSFIEDGGGCHEGTGYWNYGMHYAMRYVLSWERATGRQHPAFQIEELAKSLNFPVDFTGLSFGDNDGWHPTGMFFLVADRLNQPNAALRAAAYLPDGPYVPRKARRRLARVATGDCLYAADVIPTTQTMAEFRARHAKKKEPLARVYKGLGWAILADDAAFPSLRLSARGGSSTVRGHGHIDLLSFKCMVNGERMIEDQHGGGYGPVTFSSRGYQLYSRSASAKSTLFVDGLSCRENAQCEETGTVEGEGLVGIRIDGAAVYMPQWRAQFIGRLFLLVDGNYWLVIDSAAGHRMESRFHTYADVERGEDWAVLTRGDQQMAMTFAAAGGGTLQESRGMPETPRRQTRILRWMSATGLHVTALHPGADRLAVEVARSDGGYAITVSGKPDYRRTVRVTKDLRLRP